MTRSAALLRGAAVATLLTTIGHLVGSPHLLSGLWAHGGENAVSVLHSYRLEAMGFVTNFFSFYAGFGWQVAAYLLGQAVVFWVLAELAPALPSAKLRLLIGIFFWEFVGATLLALVTWKSFWLPAAANAVPAAFLAAAWSAERDLRTR